MRMRLKYRKLRGMKARLHVKEFYLYPLNQSRGKHTIPSNKPFLLQETILLALFLLLLSYEVSCKPREDITKAVDSSALAQRSSALSPNSSRIRPWSLFKRHSFSKCEKPRFMVNGKLVLECKRGSFDCFDPLLGAGDGKCMSIRDRNNVVVGCRCNQ